MIDSSITGWVIWDNGPGIWAESEDGQASVYIEDNCLHYESVTDWEASIPLELIRKLEQLRTHDANCTCGASARYPGAVMGHANSCEVGKFWRNR